MCLGIFACMHAWYPHRSERMWDTWNWVSEGCEVSDGCWSLNLDYLKEQPVHLTTEPSLRPSIVYYFSVKWACIRRPVLVNFRQLDTSQDCLAVGNLSSSWENASIWLACKEDLVDVGGPSSLGRQRKVNLEVWDYPGLRLHRETLS